LYHRAVHIYNDCLRHDKSRDIAGSDRAGRVMSIFYQKRRIVAGGASFLGGYVIAV
jgi:hypothetical protein